MADTGTQFRNRIPWRLLQWGTAIASFPALDKKLCVFGLLPLVDLPLHIVFPSVL